MEDFAEKNKQLTDEVAELQEENRQLKDMLYGDSTIPWDWGLSPSQAAILRCLIARPEVHYETIEAAIYFKREPPENVMSVLRAQMRYLRLKLKPFGVEIHNKSGFGYYLDPATRKRLRRDLKP
ncbi:MULTISPECIES: helix-turn-helix domain-containing protein [unclassified Roseibium]|uniref:helix-turn-helix domain-containing protein n=1 Tax=unclassified Roseibium TaxID=2629323 RepID=UPI00273D8B6B|nr:MULTISPECIES: helix-turn-helix domain-containing protein [unclassified Roseibium]